MAPVKLVSPERVLHVVSDVRELEALVQRIVENNPSYATRKQRNALLGNMKQLCGWAAVGKDREPRKETANWQLLPDVV